VAGCPAGSRGSRMGAPSYLCPAIATWRLRSSSSSYSLVRPDAGLKLGSFPFAVGSDPCVLRPNLQR
jgi:hypothetical protein